MSQSAEADLVYFIAREFIRLGRNNPRSAVANGLIVRLFAIVPRDSFIKQDLAHAIAFRGTIAIRRNAYEATMMSTLERKVHTALDEVRILWLVVQVIVGFGFQAPFLPGFDTLPESSRYMKACSLTIMLLALAILLLPAAYHHIVEGGEDTQGFCLLITRATAIGMAPLAIGIGSEVYITSQKIGGALTGATLGVAFGGLPLLLWYGLSLIGRRPKMLQNEKVKATGLEDKVDHALTEARVVLPGSQALLGFQLAVTLTQSFDRLPVAARQLHLASLCSVAISAILLMTPAAVHRLRERGEASEPFLRFAERYLLTAMGFLALGTSVEFGVVVWTIFRAETAAILVGAAMLAFFLTLWFLYPILMRQTGTSRSISRTPRWERQAARK